MAAQNFAARGDLEALARAAMGLQLHFRFRSVPWHCESLSSLNACCALSASMLPSCFNRAAAGRRPYKTDLLRYCACGEAVCPTDRVAPAPFLGAKSAT